MKYKFVIQAEVYDSAGARLRHVPIDVDIKARCVDNAAVKLKKALEKLAEETKL